MKPGDLAPGSVWRRASFSFRFAAILGIMGVLIAAVPLTLAYRQTRTVAAERSSDKASVVSSVLQGQQRSLAVYSSGLAAQLVLAMAAGQSVPTLLEQDAAKNDPGDVIGVVDTPAIAMARAGAMLDTAQPFSRALIQVVRGGQGLGADDQGHPWIVAAAPVVHGSVFIARPLTFLRDIAAIVRGDRVVADGTFADRPVVPGTMLGAAIPSDTRAFSGIVSADGSDVAIDVVPMPGGFSYLVSTVVTALPFVLQPEVLLLLALILVAMLLIIAIVQNDLQRPLRRLDRAVAALGQGDLETSVPSFGSNDEIDRLAASFEAMRNEMATAFRATRSRATIASELNAAQPLQSALEKVCRELHTALAARIVLLAVEASEMADSFVVAHGMASDAEADPERLLRGNGPIGQAFRATNGDTMFAQVPERTVEATMGLENLWLSPLHIGRRNLGVLSVEIDSPRGDLAEVLVSLVSGTAEQVALALERYRFLALVQRQASVDELTGLHNHRFLIDYLGQQVALAERLNKPLALLMLDIDHFKQLNDTYGHPAGDSALQLFAETLRSSIRRSDLAGRYGGEEFVVVMANTNAEEARLVAEKIRAAVAAVHLELEGRDSVAMTVSVGGAAFPCDTQSAGDLFRIADEALYRAKGAGRNRVAMASDALDLPQAAQVRPQSRRRRNSAR